MNVDDQVAGSSRFEDRSKRLVIFGALQIIMGGCCALLFLFMLLALMVGPSTGAPTNVRTMIPGLGMYALLAVLLVWLGIGSILARRWARALTLVLAWMILVMGVLTLITISVWMPNIFKLAAQEQQIPPQVMIFTQVVMLGTLGCIYIVLPGMFILVYRSPHVKATCDVKDPHVRWTDKCPLPVLALSLLLGFGAFSMIYTLYSGFGIPFFGILLKGVPGALMVLGITLLFAYLAWATYKLKMGAWWTTLVTYVVLFLSAAITFSRISLMEFYREMNIPEEQLNLIEDSGIIERMNMPLMMSVSTVALVGFMLWVRRYFVAGSAARSDS